MGNVYNNWAWKPDGNTSARLKDGSRKCRRPELSPKRIEEIQMETNAESTANGSNGAIRNEVAAANRRLAAKKPAKKVVKKAVKKVAAKTEVDPDRIALKTICQKLEMDPRLARRKLRKAKITGHSEKDRWSFKKGSPAYDKAMETLRA